MIERALEYPLHALMATVRAYVRFAPNETGKKALVRGFHGLRRLFFFDTQSKVMALSPRTVTTTTQFGAQLRCAVPTDQIGTFIYLFGIWEPHVTAWISSRLKPGDVFVDVGANLGYYSLLASRLVGETGKVIAVEASPSICEMLKTNVALNGATNISTINMAVTEKSGSVDIHRGPAFNLGLTSIHDTHPASVFEASVPSGPLAAVVGSDLSRARLIKIDVEGAEWEVVRGLADALPSLRDDAELVMEISPQKGHRRGESVESILELFRSHGYKFYALDNDYRAISYLEAMRSPRRARRIEVIDRQVDLVISRADL